MLALIRAVLLSLLAGSASGCSLCTGEQALNGMTIAGEYNGKPYTCKEAEAWLVGDAATMDCAGGQNLWGATCCSVPSIPSSPLSDEAKFRAALAAVEAAAGGLPPAAAPLVAAKTPNATGSDGSEQLCKPAPDHESIGTTSAGSAFTLPVTCDFAVKSAVAAGTTAKLACKSLAAVTLNELAERYRAQPATSDFALPRGLDADAMHAIDLCETTCYEYGVGRCFDSVSDEPPGITLILAVGLIVLVVVCVLKKKKCCCFRAKTLPGEVTPAATVSMNDLPDGAPYARMGASEVGVPPA